MLSGTLLCKCVLQLQRLTYCKPFVPCEESDNAAGIEAREREREKEVEWWGYCSSSWRTVTTVTEWEDKKEQFHAGVDRKFAGWHRTIKKLKKVENGKWRKKKIWWKDEIEASLKCET